MTKPTAPAKSKPKASKLKIKLSLKPTNKERKQSKAPKTKGDIRLQKTKKNVKKRPNSKSPEVIDLVTEKVETVPIVIEIDDIITQVEDDKKKNKTLQDKTTANIMKQNSLKSPIITSKTQKITRRLLNLAVARKEKKNAKFLESIILDGCEEEEEKSYDILKALGLTRIVTVDVTPLISSKNINTEGNEKKNVLPVKPKLIDSDKKRKKLSLTSELDQNKPQLNLQEKRKSPDRKSDEIPSKKLKIEKKEKSEPLLKINLKNEKKEKKIVKSKQVTEKIKQRKDTNTLKPSDKIGLTKTHKKEKKLVSTLPIKKVATKPKCAVKKKPLIKINLLKNRVTTKKIVSSKKKTNIVKKKLPDKAETEKTKTILDKSKKAKKLANVKEKEKSLINKKVVSKPKIVNISSEKSPVDKKCKKSNSPKVKKELKTNNKSKLLSKVVKSPSKKDSLKSPIKNLNSPPIDTYFLKLTPLKTEKENGSLSIEKAKKNVFNGSTLKLLKETVGGKNVPATTEKSSNKKKAKVNRLMAEKENSAKLISPTKTFDSKDKTQTSIVHFFNTSPTKNLSDNIFTSPKKLLGISHKFLTLDRKCKKPQIKPKGSTRKQMLQINNSDNLKENNFGENYVTVTGRNAQSINDEPDVEIIEDNPIIDLDQLETVSDIDQIISEKKIETDRVSSNIKVDVSKNPNKKTWSKNISETIKTHCDSASQENKRRNDSFEQNKKSGKENLNDVKIKGGPASKQKKVVTKPDTSTHKDNAKKTNDDNKLNNSNSNRDNDFIKNWLARLTKQNIKVKVVVPDKQSLLSESIDISDDKDVNLVDYSKNVKSVAAEATEKARNLDITINTDSQGISVSKRGIERDKIKEGIKKKSGKPIKIKKETSNKKTISNNELSLEENRQSMASKKNPKAKSKTKNLPISDTVVNTKDLQESNVSHKSSKSTFCLNISEKKAGPNRKRRQNNSKKMSIKDEILEYSKSNHLQCETSTDTLEIFESGNDSQASEVLKEESSKHVTCGKENKINETSKRKRDGLSKAGRKRINKMCKGDEIRENSEIIQFIDVFSQEDSNQADSPEQRGEIISLKKKPGQPSKTIEIKSESTSKSDGALGKMKSSPDAINKEATVALKKKGRTPNTEEKPICAEAENVEIEKCEIVHMSLTYNTLNLKTETLENIQCQREKNLESPGGISFENEGSTASLNQSIVDSANIHFHEDFPETEFFDISKIYPSPKTEQRFSDESNKSTGGSGERTSDINKFFNVDDKKIHCRTCDVIYENKVAYEIHRRLLHPRSEFLKCKICCKCFKSRRDLQKHKIQLHSGDHPYTCNKCEASFSFLETLISHSRTHEGKDPFICKVCEAPFELRSEYTEHMKVHRFKKVEKVKNYKCETCGYEFSKLCDLLRHQRKHTGEKPYMCQICQKRFMQAHNLTKHITIHTQEKRYECDICSKKFSRSDVLTRHMLSHSVDKPFQCPHCDKNFARPVQLKTHSTKYHPGMEED